MLLDGRSSEAAKWPSNCHVNRKRTRRWAIRHPRGPVPAPLQKEQIISLMRALPSSSRDLPLLLPEWILLALRLVAVCHTLKMLDRGQGSAGTRPEHRCKSGMTGRLHRPYIHCVGMYRSLHLAVSEDLSPLDFFNSQRVFPGDQPRGIGPTLWRIAFEAPAF
jgi:hypothetical protein